MTTTDLARMDTTAVTVLGNANDALARLGEWVRAASSARALVAPLIDTAFVPDAYRPKVERGDSPQQIAAKREMAINNATAAVLQGISLGVDPLVALQQIYVVHFRPGLYAKFMVALVQSHGHEVWTQDLTDTRAIVCGRRSGSEHTETVTITMDMARKAKWTSNTKYAETPQDMLWARAAGRVCDRIASDVLKGLVTVEQIRDEVFSTTAEVAGNGQRTVRAPRRSAPTPAIEAAAEEEPELVEERTEPVEQPSPQPSPKLITGPQQKMLHALLNQHGKGDRDLGLVFIAGVIGREIDSTKELSTLEAGAVIDTLTAMQGDDDEPALDEPA